MSNTFPPEPTRLTRENIPKRFSEPQSTVLLVVQSLLDVLDHRDYSKIESIIVPAGGTARLRPNGLQLMSLGDLSKQLVGAPQGIEEYMYGQPRVMITDSEELAMIWTRCRILINGVLLSEAVNAISLHKEKGGQWKISSVSDATME